MRKVQMIFDRMQHVSGVNDPALDEQLNRVKEIYHKQQITNNNIIDYYTILSATEKKEIVVLNDFIKELELKYHWRNHCRLIVEPLKSIEGDTAHLELLFRHIIGNSICFRSPERELEVHIHEVRHDETIPELKSGDYYAFAISDNGIGIAPEYLSKMFGLFEKMQSSGDTQQSGMGLSFCKRIMQNHDGWISARQNSPNGLSILLFFPK